MDEIAHTFRGSPTEAEHLLWHRLRRRRIGGFRFRRHVPVGRYVCDFVCPQARLVVELDGSQYFEHADYDGRRAQYLQWQGLRVLRFWNADVLNHPDEVLVAINAALDAPEASERFD
jgi:very-short-patch-repair endonuclease